MLTSRMSLRVPPHTANRMGRIRDLLVRAIGELRQQLRRSPSRSPVKRHSEQSSQGESIHEVLSNLKKGYLMVKHSEKISEPHDKFVYLSEDSRFLCWKSLDRDDEKRIDVTEIQKVVKEGAEFFIRGCKIKDINKCVVIVAPQRRLQIEATSEEEAEYFRYEMNRVLKFWKGMRLNYKYNKN